MSLAKEKAATDVCVFICLGKVRLFKRKNIKKQK